MYSIEATFNKKKFLIDPLFLFSTASASPSTELKTQSEAIPPYNINAKTPDEVYLLKDSKRKRSRPGQNRPFLRIILKQLKQYSFVVFFLNCGSLCLNLHKYLKIIKTNRPDTLVILKKEHYPEPALSPYEKLVQCNIL